MTLPATDMARWRLVVCCTIVCLSSLGKLSAATNRFAGNHCRAEPSAPV